MNGVRPAAPKNVTMPMCEMSNVLMKMLVSLFITDCHMGITVAANFPDENESQVQRQFPSGWF